MRNLLKQLKLNESTISMILGAIVIVVVGLLVINYFKGLEPASQLPDGIATEEGTLPTSHTVQGGETLWDISERYYESGYNWIDIQEANDLPNPNAIEEGQSLVIPDVASRGQNGDLADLNEDGDVSMEESPELVATAEVVETSTPEATATPVATQAPEPTDASDEDETNKIEGEQYTVARGDSLWDIAVRAYGDGYRWVDIARANNLDNPDIIHAGNVFTLPR